MVLRMHNARPVTRASAPELYASGGRSWRSARSCRCRRVYLIETDQPNAFATGRDPHHSAVAVTRGLLQSLGRDELAGVIAHELAHIKNRDTLTMTIAATIAGAIGFLGQFAFFFGGSRDGERAEPDRRHPDHDPGPAGGDRWCRWRSRARASSRPTGWGRRSAACRGPWPSALQRIEQLATGRVMPTAEHNPASAHLFIINPLRLGGVDNLFRTHPRPRSGSAALLALEQAQAAPASAPAGGNVRYGSVPKAGGRRGPWS